MGSRTRFFGTVLALLALNIFYFRPTDPTETTEPTESEPQQEQIDSPDPAPRSTLPGLDQVAQGWSRLSQAMSRLWGGTAPDAQL